VGGQVSTTDPPAGGELTEGKFAQIFLIGYWWFAVKIRLIALSPQRSIGL